VGADVHASGLVLTFAAIALFGTYERWHCFLLFIALVVVFSKHKLGRNMPVRIAPGVF
jgi:hypothetical protein